MAACTTVGQPLAALRLLVITLLWKAYCTARSRPDRQVTPAHITNQGVGSSQGPDAPRLAPGGIRHQAAGRSIQPLAQREAANHDSGAVPAALVPWRCSLQPGRGYAGATHQEVFLSVSRSADMIGIDGHASFLPPKEKKKAGSLPRL